MQGSTMNARGAFSLSKDSHVTTGPVMELVGEVLGWFASYSSSKSSTWKAK